MLSLLPRWQQRRCEQARCDALHHLQGTSLPRSYTEVRAALRARSGIGDDIDATGNLKRELPVGYAAVLLQVAEGERGFALRNVVVAYMALGVRDHRDFGAILELDLAAHAGERTPLRVRDFCGCW